MTEIATALHEAIDAMRKAAILMIHSNNLAARWHGAKLASVARFIERDWLPELETEDE